VAIQPEDCGVARAQPLKPFEDCCALLQLQPRTQKLLDSWTGSAGRPPGWFAQQSAQSKGSSSDPTSAQTQAGAAGHGRGPTAQGLAAAGLAAAECFETASAPSEQLPAAAMSRWQGRCSEELCWLRECAAWEAICCPALERNAV